MITAQDIREKTFEKSTFGGYAMNEVDDFLDELASDLAASQKETATLRSKMKILVDKVEEYRASEDAMHQALVTAQKVAKTIQDESQAKADELLAGAKAEAESIVAAAQAEAERITGGIAEKRQMEELRYQKAQSGAAEYIQNTTQKLAEALSFLNAMKEADLSAIVTPAPDERKAIPAPAEAAEAAPEAYEAAPVESAPAEEEPPLDVPGYVQAFEKAVYDYDETIPEAEDGDSAPMFRF